MGVELIPSITATTVNQLRRFSALAQALSTTVHLDIMDGKFVTTRSVGLKQLAAVNWKRKLEIHAMVNNVVSLSPMLDVLKPRRVYLHIERGASLLPFIALLRTRKIECGLAIKPHTPLRMLKPYVRYAKSILLLAVQPGRYHAPLQPHTYTRIKKVHEFWPPKTIVVDGSMNERTIRRAFKAGAKRIIVGSAVILSEHPSAQWRKLRALTK